MRSGCQGFVCFVLETSRRASISFRRHASVDHFVQSCLRLVRSKEVELPHWLFNILVEETKSEKRRSFV